LGQQPQARGCWVKLMYTITPRRGDLVMGPITVDGTLAPRGGKGPKGREGLGEPWGKAE